MFVCIVYLCICLRVVCFVAVDYDSVKITHTSLCNCCMVNIMFRLMAQYVVYSV